MSAVSAMKPGIGGVVYRNTGTYATPSWTAQTLVKDAMVPSPYDFAEAGSRETRAKLYMKTRIDLQHKIVMRADDANAGVLAFRAAAVSATAVVDLLILDAPITIEGAHGFRSEYLVSLADEPQEIEGSIYDTFELKTPWTTNGYPSSVIMGTGSAPSITAF